jgi:hypothetical protein
MALASLDQKLRWPLRINQSLFDDAKKILRTSYNFNDVKQICRFLLDSQTAVAVLQERPDHWLDVHLNDLCRYKGPHCDSRASKAKAIVNIVRDSAPCGDRLDGYWICEALASPDITSNAAHFDTEVHSKFSEIPFSHLVL